MSASDLRRLERLKTTYGEGVATAKLGVLRRLSRSRLRTAGQVERLHEALCFLRAYPDDASVLAQVTRMLERFDRRPVWTPLLGRDPGCGDLLYIFLAHFSPDSTSQSASTHSSSYQ